MTQYKVSNSIFVITLVLLQKSIKHILLLLELYFECDLVKTPLILI